MYKNHSTFIKFSEADSFIEFLKNILKKKKNAGNLKNKVIFFSGVAMNNFFTFWATILEWFQDVNFHDNGYHQAHFKTRNTESKYIFIIYLYFRNNKKNLDC